MNRKIIMSEEKLDSIKIASIKNLFSKNSYNLQRIISIITKLKIIKRNDFKIVTERNLESKKEKKYYTNTLDLEEKYLTKSLINTNRIIEIHSCKKFMKSEKLS